MGKLIQAILKRPSVRTQMESSIAGISVIMLSSLAITTLMIINGTVAGAMKWFIISGEVGILLFQYSLLSTTYQNLVEYKLNNKLYPIEYQLQVKIEEANKVKEDLDRLLNTLKLKEEEVKKC